MRSLHTAILALLALVAFPATAHAETADVPAVCVADATADAALPAVVLGSSEFQAALESGATFIGADEAMEVPSTCFAVYEVYDGDGNFIGYLLVPVDDSFCE